MNKKIFLSILCSMLVLTGCGKKEEIKKEPEKKQENDIVIDEKVDIIDLESNARPYALVVNNYPSAVKVQSGLDKAYLVYEFPIEGGMSRSLALYKDVTDVKVGTIRSARHDYIDYVLENDAIFVHFSISYMAGKQIERFDIDNIDGMNDDPFWRENPEGLPYEHTAYTNLSNLIEYTNSYKKYRTTTDVKPPLNYSTDDVALSGYEESMVANNVEITYHSTFKVKFVYNNETKKYDRFFNDMPHTDYFTQKQYDCKNIIVILIDWGYDPSHVDPAGNNYLDLYNTGTGKGYYITNGYAKEIIWSKQNVESKTVYTYLDGSEIEISDGNTWVMFQPKNQSIEIN